MRLYLYMGLVLLLIQACKKEKDNEPPVITITAPSGLPTFSVIDTIFVEGTITDNNTISTVAVDITDASAEPVVPGITLTPGTSSYHLHVNYVINDIHLETGTYYIMVTANDGRNISKSFIKIILSGIQRKLNGIYLFSGSGNSTLVYSLDTAGNTFMKYTFPEPLQDELVNSWTQQMCMSGKNTGLLQSLQLPGFSEKWDKTLHSGAYPFIGRLYLAAPLVFAGSTIGMITGYDEDGIIRQTASVSNSEFPPSLFYKHDNYFVVYESSFIPAPSRIEIISYSSGTPLFYHNIDFNVTGMFWYDTDISIIFGNSNGVARACTLNLENNIAYDLNGFGSDSLLSVVMPEEGTWILGIGSHLYRYDHDAVGLLLFKPNIEADGLKYDDLSATLYASKGNSLTLIHYPDGVILRTYTLPFVIRGVDFLYNK